MIRGILDTDLNLIEIQHTQIFTYGRLPVSKPPAGISQNRLSKGRFYQLRFITRQVG